MNEDANEDIISAVPGNVIRSTDTGALNPGNEGITGMMNAIEMGDLKPGIVVTAIFCGSTGVSG